MVDKTIFFSEESFQKSLPSDDLGISSDSMEKDIFIGEAVIQFERIYENGLDIDPTSSHLFDIAPSTNLLALRPTTTGTTATKNNIVPFQRGASRFPQPGNVPATSIPVPSISPSQLGPTLGTPGSSNGTYWTLGESRVNARFLDSLINNGSATAQTPKGRFETTLNRDTLTTAIRYLDGIYQSAEPEAHWSLRQWIYELNFHNGLPSDLTPQFEELDQQLNFFLQHNTLQPQSTGTPPYPVLKSPRHDEVEQLAPSNSGPRTDDDSEDHPKLRIEINQLDGNELDDLVLKPDTVASEKPTVDIHIWLENGRGLGQSQAITLSQIRGTEHGDIEFQDPYTGKWQQELVLPILADATVATLKARGRETSLVADDVKIKAEPLFRGNTIRSADEELTVFSFDEVKFELTEAAEYSLATKPNGSMIYTAIGPDNQQAEAVIYRGGASITPELPEGAEHQDPIKNLRLGLIQEIFDEVELPGGQTTLPSQDYFTYIPIGNLRSLESDGNDIPRSQLRIWTDRKLRPTSQREEQLKYEIPKYVGIASYLPNPPEGKIFLDAYTDQLPFYKKYDPSYRAFTRDPESSVIAASVDSHDTPNLQGYRYIGVPMLDANGGYYDWMIYKIQSAAIQTSFKAHLVFFNEQTGELIQLREQDWQVNVNSKSDEEQKATVDTRGSSGSSRVPDVNAPVAEPKHFYFASDEMTEIEINTDSSP